MKKLWYLLLLPLMMGMAACSSDSDDDEERNGQVGNDKDKPIVTGGIESASISMDYRGILCKLYGYCNMQPEVIALSEVGIEVYTYEKYMINGRETELVFTIPAKQVNSEGKFIVSTEDALTEEPESLNTEKMRTVMMPIVYTGNNECTIRAYIKTGDLYQYGEFQQVHVPNQKNLIDPLVVNTGSIAKGYYGGYKYTNTYASVRLAITKDKSLLTPESIIEAENEATLIESDSMLGYYHWTMGALHLYCDVKPYPLNPQNISSDCTIDIGKLIQPDYTPQDYYYCEYYYGNSGGSSVIKMGEIKTYNRSNDY